MPASPKFLMGENSQVRRILLIFPGKSYGQGAEKKNRYRYEDLISQVFNVTVMCDLSLRVVFPLRGPGSESPPPKFRGYGLTGVFKVCGHLQGTRNFVGPLVGSPEGLRPGKVTH